MLLARKQLNQFQTGLLGLFLFVWAQVSIADVSGGTNDPKLLFEQMLVAKDDLMYQGSLTYEQSGQLFSYSVDSTSLAAPGSQSLSLLNGPPREYQFRVGQNCEPGPDTSIEQLGNWYNFYYVGPSRTAGRDGHEINLLPVDQFRLGYSYVVDEDTGLMLRSVTMLPDRKVLERIQFIDLEILSPEANQDLDGSDESSLPNATVAEVIDDNAAEEPCLTEPAASDWILGWVPEGFQAVKQTTEGERVSLVYGDGLSTFSLFIEAVDGASMPPGNIQRGAITIVISYYSRPDQTFMVTFVGEVPLSAAERILQGLEQTL